MDANAQLDPDPETNDTSASAGHEPVNQKHIAQRLGLSTATVSRSLRNDESIRATTRARVFKAAQELGYRIPEARRGAVRTRRIKTLQLLVGSATGLGPAGDEIIAGISEAASAHDAHLSVFVSPPNSGGRLVGDFEPPAMRAGLVDGAILLHSFAPEVVADLATKLPVVSMVHRFDNLPIDCIDTDERLGVIQLFATLEKAGHQHIGFVRLEGGKSWERARLSGFHESCFSRGLTNKDAPMVSLSGEMGNAAKVAAEIEAHRARGVTAWICACDPVAYRVTSELRSRGVEVGPDFVVAGFDGLPPPPGESQIPTIRVPYRDLGGAAVRRLAHRIESPTSRIRDILLRHDFVAGYLAGRGLDEHGAAVAVPPVASR